MTRVLGPVAVACVTAAVVVVWVVGVPRVGRLPGHKAPSTRGTVGSRIADALAFHRSSFWLLPNSYLFPM